ncbi:recombinase family protein [Bifidobacterium coryneforme]|uniref:recombinase family protein n=1 Tax=Bifidobacterium coryneforme TaxID=1687 RepID=UPI00192C5877|nr:recombinase family protein [Bifidobacterium indicum]
MREYEDAAISGTTDARPGFQLILSEVAKGRLHTRSSCGRPTVWCATSTCW